jgi:hypothetical protein
MACTVTLPEAFSIGYPMMQVVPRPSLRPLLSSSSFVLGDQQAEGFFLHFGGLILDREWFHQ